MRCARRAWWSRFVRSGVVATGIALLPALGTRPLIAQATARITTARITTARITTARITTARDTTTTRAPGPWFAGLSLGYGSLDLSSDQRTGGARDVFVMGFRGSRAINERLRLGIDLGGWLLQPSDVWDPSQGESVSAFGAFAQIFPLARTPMFVEIGGGAATYTHHAPDDFERHGSGWTLGTGYEFRARERLTVVPSVNVSGGRFGEISNPVLTETGLAYRAWDVRLAGIARFGRR